MESGSASTNGPCLANDASRSSLLCEDKSNSSANGLALTSDSLLSVQKKSLVIEGSPIGKTDKDEEPLEKQRQGGHRDEENEKWRRKKEKSTKLRWEKERKKCKLVLSSRKVHKVAGISHKLKETRKIKAGGWKGKEKTVEGQVWKREVE